LVNLCCARACYPRPRLVVGHPLTGATEKAAERVDRVAEDAMHEIDGIAAKQGEERLPGRRRQRRAGRRRVHEENENQLRNHDPVDHAIAHRVQ
jgi:hypothetical protein